jgi:hypothetical protein
MCSYCVVYGFLTEMCYDHLSVLLYNNNVWCLEDIFFWGHFSLQLCSDLGSLGTLIYVGRPGRAHPFVQLQWKPHDAGRQGTLVYIVTMET